MGLCDFWGGTSGLGRFDRRRIWDFADVEVAVRSWQLKSLLSRVFWGLHAFEKDRGGGVLGLRLWGRFGSTWGFKSPKTLKP